MEPFFAEDGRIQDKITLDSTSTDSKKRMRHGVAASIILLALCVPLIASASVFSEWIREFSQSATASSLELNSQTVPLLAPATNIDPRPVGGGDIAIVGGSALLPQGGPSGTLADIAQEPGSTQISIYTVHKGDTLSGIAKMYGVSVNTVVWANDELKGGKLREGQQLVILPITGVRHTVGKGDTLQSIAKKYKADVDEIESFNDLSNGLSAGDVIVIPDGEVSASVPRRSGAASPVRGAGGPSVAGYYAWPVDGGVVTQGLHGFNGIDIGSRGGTSIFASAAGAVIVARSGGWNGGYGSYVVIQHGNGTQTLYAHLSRVSVSPGQHVAQGETIGVMGATGKATGVHLHFEVRGAANPFR